MEMRIPAWLCAAFSVVLAVVLAACGGSDERLVDKYQLRPTVHVAEFSGPYGEGYEGSLEQCVYVYVVLLVDSEQGRPLPSDFKVLHAGISRENSGVVVWRATPDPRESYFESPTRFKGLAKGCSAGFATGEKVTVKLRLAGNGVEDEVDVSTAVDFGNQ